MYVCVTQRWQNVWAPRSQRQEQNKISIKPQYSDREVKQPWNITGQEGNRDTILADSAPCSGKKEETGFIAGKSKIPKHHCCMPGKFKNERLAPAYLASKKFTKCVPQKHSQEAARQER